MGCQGGRIQCSDEDKGKVDLVQRSMGAVTQSTECATNNLTFLDPKSKYVQNIGIININK